MLLFATAVFVYYTFWTFVTPFIDADSAIQALFPPRYYAIALPVVALILGTCVILSFVGLVILKSTRKEKKKNP